MPLGTGARPNKTKQIARLRTPPRALHCAHNSPSDLRNLVQARSASCHRVLVRAISTIVWSQYAKGHRQRQVWCLAPGACTAYPSYVRVVCACLRVPCPLLRVCQPVCLSNCHVTASTYVHVRAPCARVPIRLFARANQRLFVWLTCSIAVSFQPKGGISASG